MSDKVFKSIDEWDEEDGCCLFFKLDAGGPPVVTSPISSDWDEGYFTHWMKLPKELLKTTDYRAACIESGIKTTL